MNEDLRQDHGASPDAGAAREQRFACVGIALVYSARDDRSQAELGRLLHRAATHDMSLKGLSFDVPSPMAEGETLAVLVGQPDTEDCEQLLTTVCWCRQLEAGHFRVGVRINQSRPVLLDASQAQAMLAGQLSPAAMPSSVEFVCPACGQRSVFERVGDQPVANHQGGVMPLYDCSVCETTRSIMGLLAYARRGGAAAAPGGTTAPATIKEKQTMTLKRVLYAEDEPDIQTVAKLALEMVGGFEVLICNNGAEALKQVGDFAPQLILLDVMMPTMDGPTTLKHLRANPATADIPVIFLTAKVQPTEVAHYQSLGAINVLAKPFDPMTLAAQVRALWENRSA